MIFTLPAFEEPIDQGDIIDSCPLLVMVSFQPDNLLTPSVETSPSRVIVLTQTCDLAQKQLNNAVCAPLRDAQELVDNKTIKLADLKGPVRAGRVWGWYFLPKNVPLGLPEMIVDLRQLHTVRMDLLTTLASRGRRRARVQPLYREHLARHFAETYARIGLPEPYPTDDDRLKTATPSPAPGNS